MAADQRRLLAALIALETNSDFKVVMDWMH